MSSLYSLGAALDGPAGESSIASTGADRNLDGP